MILPDIENPFFPEVASAIIKTAAGFGYTVFLCITDWDLDQQTAYIETLIENRVEGLTICPIEDSNAQIQTLIGTDIPVVYVSETQQGAECSYVAIDNSRGVTVGNLASNRTGAIKPVYYFGVSEGKLTNNERFEGYQLALKELTRDQLNPHRVLKGDHDPPHRIPDDPGS